MTQAEIDALGRELAEARAEVAATAADKARLSEDLRETLARQRATADLFRIVSQSVSDVAPVFDAILDSCLSLFSPYGAAIYRVEGEMVRGVARRGFADGDWGMDARPLAGSSTARVIADQRALHIEDLADDPKLPEDKRAAVRGYGGLSVLYVPMRTQSRGIGSLVVARRPKKPFTDAEIAFLGAFADQAVIAIENARLFGEVKARTRDLSEALAYQTGAADILRVIASSPTDVAPVLQAIVDSACEVCGAYDAAVIIREGDFVRFAAHRGPIPLGMDGRPLNRGWVGGRAVLDRAPVHVPDLQRAGDEFPVGRDMALAMGHRTILAVPLLRAGESIGAIVVRRNEAHPFTDKQIDVLRHFADQAVIAIGNVRLFDEVQARTRELEEALAQQTATAEVLKVISRSPSDLKPVLDTIADTAARLCGSDMTMFFRYDGELFRILASWNFPPDVQEMLERRPLAPGHASALGRAGATLRPVYIPDVLEDPAYGLVGEQTRARYRATLAVPMLREGRLVGALSLNRAEPGSFTPSHIAFVSTFADQAAIAFENVRLFEEVRARTHDLEDSLAQQTATANALKVISRSALGLHEVMQTLIDSAVRLCADDGVVYLRHGDVFLAEAAFDADEEKVRARNRTPRAPGRSSMTGRVALSGEIEFIPDTLADGEFEVAPDLRLKGIRSLVGVPLLREGQVEGVFILGRREPGRFGARAVELAKTFADQAVIVIENVRLLEEVRARTRDVEQALKQQTTTSEILRVISQSPTDARPVFESIVVAAARLLRCDTAFVQLVEGRNWRNVAVATPAGLGEVTLTETSPIDPELDFPSRAIVAKETVYLPHWSVLDMPAHQLRVQELYGFKASLHLPLLRDQECVGVLTLLSRRAHAFGEAEITQSRSFRDQALIAIENARLFHETQESLAQQTATADVLKVISRSVFDLDAVLQTLIDTAVRLARGSRGTIFIRDGDVLRARAFHSQVPPSLKDYLIANPTPLDSDEPMALVARGGRLIHVPDMSVYDTERVRETRKRVGFGAGLWVPLMRDGEAIGLFGVPREEAIAFTDREIELVRTFADQAVIAIENARLFEEVRSRTRELEQSLDNLRKTQDRLVQSEKLASLGQLTAGIAHEIKNPLNFVNNFATLSRELLEELRETLGRLPEDARADADDLIGLIDRNLEKVASHGKRADSIVKNMLLHSREGSGERTRVNVNAMVEEALNLGYHGSRAENPGFNVTIEKSLDPECGEADLYLQEITRVLLNLISNGFYATAKRRETEGPDYQPTLKASTRSVGDRVEIRIFDNGTGVPDEVRAKMFNPFFTTKPAGDGTGLGLSLTHDIVVKQHGGAIEVETALGAFTEFIVTLPKGSPGA